MKLIPSLAIIAIAMCLNLSAGQPAFNPAHIDVYITPYYNSDGPTVSVGKFSKGLAAKNESQVVETITKMKESWATLSFAELYVASIRLYDLGYRKESIYWYYTAQYRGRLFGMLLDKSKMGGIGSKGFELLQAQGAFFQLAGPYITGYAFTNFDHLMEVIAQVRKEGEGLPDMKAAYSGVKFLDQSEWAAQNKDLNNGMGKLLETFKQQKAMIHERRIAEGTAAQYEKLENKELTRRYSE